MVNLATNLIHVTLLGDSSKKLLLIHDQTSSKNVFNEATFERNKRFLTLNQQYFFVCQVFVHNNLKYLQQLFQSSFYYIVPEKLIFNKV